MRDNSITSMARKALKTNDERLAKKILSQLDTRPLSRRVRDVVMYKSSSGYPDWGGKLWQAWRDYEDGKGEIEDILRVAKRYRKQVSDVYHSWEDIIEIIQDELK